MIDDPILQLERELAGAAARGRPARRRRFAVPAVAVAAAAAAVVVLVVAGRSPSPSVAATAYAHLSNGIVYLRSESRSYNGGKLSTHGRAELWYRGGSEHSIATRLGPRTGREAGYLEVARDAKTITSYESTANVLTLQVVCRASSRDVDPVAKFRSLYEQGRVTERGTTTFDGKPVARLVATEGPQEFTYLVTPKSGEPVAMRVRFKGRPGPFTGTVTRFLAHDDGLTDTSRLRMGSHPGAKRVDLGRSRCRG